MTEAEPSYRPLNVFFDVDNTLIMWNGRLRQHTRMVFQELKDHGHTIYVWSGVGIRRWDMKRHELDEFVTDYFIKPLDRHHEKLEALGVPMVPDFVIDDHLSVVTAFGGYHIKDEAAPDDRELLDVLERIHEMARAPFPGEGHTPVAHSAATIAAQAAAAMTSSESNAAGA